ncbi:MAG: recombinase RecT [Candidatus Eisenbacteria bacterium]
MAQQNTGQIVTSEQKYNSLRGLLEKNKAQIAMALPKHLHADRMLRIVLTSVRKNPKLLTCDQESFMAAVMTASQLGVEPDGVTGRAWLLPYWNGKLQRNEVQLRVGYQGLMDLARNSREIGGWFVGAVREKDTFDYQYGSEQFLRHRPYDGPGDAGDLKFAYAGARLKDGSVQFRVLNRVQIQRAKDASSSRDRDGKLVGPWITDEEEMWIKTAIRRVVKILPASPEMRAAAAIDELAERGMPQNLTADMADLPPAAPDEDIEDAPFEEQQQTTGEAPRQEARSADGDPARTETASAPPPTRAQQAVRRPAPTAQQQRPTPRPGGNGGRVTAPTVDL